MSGVANVDPSEVIIKHIPNIPKFMGTTAPARITSANFELRNGETGSSCSRLAITSPIEMLNNLRCRVGSKVAAASVKEIVDLGFSVVSVPEEYDAGHAEICDGASRSLSSHRDRKALSKLFQFLPLEVVEVYDTMVTFL